MIRSIEPTDLARILRINEANVPEVGSVDADRLAFIVAESPIALVADISDDVVGFCLVLAGGSTYDSVNYRWFTQRYDAFMYLDRVAVDSAARGRGSVPLCTQRSIDRWRRSTAPTTWRWR